MTASFTLQFVCCVWAEAGAAIQLASFEILNKRCAAMPSHANAMANMIYQGSYLLHNFHASSNITLAGPDRKLPNCVKPNFH